MIAYLSLLAILGKKEQNGKLEKKKAELATSNKLNIELIYWQDKEHRIQ